MNSADETVETEKNHIRELAHSLVEEAWNLGAKPLELAVEYEGAVWAISVRVAATAG